MGTQRQCDLFSDNTSADPGTADPTDVPKPDGRKPRPSRKTNAKRRRKKRVRDLHECVHLTVQEVAAWYAVSVPTTWRWIKENSDFPRPYKLSRGATRWSRKDLEAHDEQLRGETR